MGLFSLALMERGLWGQGPLSLVLGVSVAQTAGPLRRQPNSKRCTLVPTEIYCACLSGSSPFILQGTYRVVFPSCAICPGADVAD